MESRLRTAFLVLLGLFAVIGLRLFQLQVVEGARYERLSEQNRIRRIITRAPRGKILDRSGELLADSRASFSILLVPVEADTPGVNLLSGILEMPADEIWNRLGRSESWMTPVRLRRGADLDLVARVEENSTEIPGVIVKTEPQRYYPFGPLFAHALGYVNEITEADLTRDTSYRQGNIIGVAALEARYEPVLRGRDGSKYVIVNAWGREVTDLPEREEIAPQPGQELHLTLDAGLQQQAVKLLEPYPVAAVVGLNLQDGGVLCLYSKPGFDPNLLSGSLTQQQWDALTSDKATPFVNRTTMAVYSPGSTLKPVTALAGLRRGAVTEFTTFAPCDGLFKYGKGRFKCTGSHGRLELGPAIVHSCNTYFYQLGLKVGIDALGDMMSEMGFGAPTGIDLPAERSGTAPNRAWLDKRYGAGRWSIGVVLNLAIGQGEVQATPLQVAGLYALLAGSGDYCVPHLLDYTRDADGRVFRPTPERKHVALDPQHTRIIRQALVGVVDHGTGTGAYVPGITVAGKTGTTEHTGGEDHAWFACYAGRPNPEVVFVVLIENGGHGGTVAAPIARGLIRHYYGIREELPAPADSLKAKTGSAPRPRARRPRTKASRKR